ncbi:MAG: hypothetical protein ACKVWR_21830 [Acidimicrobiales bacterium]
MSSLAVPAITQPSGRDAVATAGVHAMDAIHDLARARMTLDRLEVDLIDSGDHDRHHVKAALLAAQKALSALATAVGHIENLEKAWPE